MSRRPKFNVLVSFVFYTRVLADLNVPKTILAHRLQSSALSCFCFQKKKSLYLYFGFMTCFLLCLVGCKKKQQQQTPFAFHFHTFFTIFSCIVAFH